MYVPKTASVRLWLPNAKDSFLAKPTLFLCCSLFYTQFLSLNLGSNNVDLQHDFINDINIWPINI